MYPKDERISNQPPEGITNFASDPYRRLSAPLSSYIREMEVLVRWASIHWDQLQGPLGFDRNKPPCATTISRTLAQCRVGDFQAALSTWLRNCLANSETEGILAPVVKHEWKNGEAGN